jgi:hypothetical protein
MSLADCMKKFGLSGCALNEGFVVYPGRGFPPALWVCNDYAVSSVSGGCVWLCRLSQSKGL